MIKVRNIYPWEVIEEVEKGNTVYFVDKVSCTVFNSDVALAPTFIKAVKCTEPNRIEFWVLEEVEETNND